MICAFLQVMSITTFDTDAEAVALANDCDFGLGSNVFSGNQVCVWKHSPNQCFSQQWDSNIFQHHQICLLNPLSFCYNPAFLVDPIAFPSLALGNYLALLAFPSHPQARARSIALRLEAGMSSINDFATTYMCQSLPFGGVKQSGFDRFAGEEGGGGHGRG